jgi:hypothetical protein
VDKKNHRTPIFAEFGANQVVFFEMMDKMSLALKKMR